MMNRTPLQEKSPLQRAHFLICSRLYQAIGDIKEFKQEQELILDGLVKSDLDPVKLEKDYRLYIEMDKLSERFYDMIDELQNDEPYKQWQE